MRHHVLDSLRPSTFVLPFEVTLIVAPFERDLPVAAFLPLPAAAAEVFVLRVVVVDLVLGLGGLVRALSSAVVT